MLNLEFDVRVGGMDYNAHIISINRNHSICDGMGTGEIDLNINAPPPDIYDTVVIEELGTKVFTGYVTNVKRGQMPVEYVIEIADPVIKLADYWTDTVYSSTGETAEYWIGFFCDLVGIDYIFDTSYNRIVPDNSRGDGIEWQYTSALNIVRELLIVGGFYMWADPDGLVHFSDINTGPNFNDPEILSFRREQNLDPTRNRTIVFGDYPIAEEVTTTVPGLAHEKTAVVASPYVETEDYALDLANKMLEVFAQPQDIKYLEIIGMPSLRVGQRLSYQDSWIDIEGRGLVVQYSSNMTNDGYTMDVTLDEFSPYIWGYSLKGRTLYAGTHGDGVWRTFDYGLLWEDITNNLPSGVAYNVRGIAAVKSDVWAATQGGVYYTPDGELVPAAGITWSDKTPLLPSGTLVSDWTDVQMQPSNLQTVYVLAHGDVNKYLYKSIDNGVLWNYVEIY